MEKDNGARRHHKLLDRLQENLDQVGKASVLQSNNLEAFAFPPSGEAGREGLIGEHKDSRAVVL